MTSTRRSAVAFTFVHDPWHVFWAGVVQALCHEKLDRAPRAPQRPRTTAKHRRKERVWRAGDPWGRALAPRAAQVAALGALVDAMVAGAFLGEPIFHAWPQALKVDARLRDARARAATGKSRVRT